MGLEVRGVVVRFGETAAVDGATLDVAAGAVVALLGPSGCGKSTLLRTIAGLESPERGSLAWAGVDLAPVPVHRRGFGLVFQEGQLFAHRDVGSNVAFGLRMAGVGRSDRVRRVAELLELVGLAGFGRRPVSTLSGGEQQRVALARALAPRPRLLLLDEPLSALDRTLREDLATELASILRNTRTTALYVTHDHDEAFTVADSVAVMSAGRILQSAPPQRLWRHPANRTVAAALGYRWFVAAERLDLSSAGTAALRAESLVVDDAGGLVGRVVSRRFTRGGTTLLVDIDGVGEVEARAAGTESGSDNGRVRLRLDPSAVALIE